MTDQSVVGSAGTMSLRTVRKSGHDRPATSWRTQSALSTPEWWVVFALAGIGLIASPLLDLTQPNPDPISAVIDTVFCVAFVVAARSPWAGLLVYALALAASFPFHEQEVVLSAIALSSCVLVRVGSIRAIAGFVALMGGGVVIVAATVQGTHGLNVFVGIPFVALVSSVIGAVLRIALGRARTLTAELQRRIQTEQAIRAEERQLISDELHDDIAHDLTVISTYISVLEQDQEQGIDPATRALALTVLGNTTRKVLDDIRLIMQQGTAIEEQSMRALAVAFDDARRELAAANLRVEVKGDPEDERVSRLVSATLSRTLREAVTNILKHHGQSPIRIELSVVGDVVCFDVTNALPKVQGQAEPGFGTIRISERIERLAGSCVIGPDGDSWVVSIRIPRHSSL
ncbi:histidine kinase [Microbacterium horticulturae]|uniref:histidine kinase n=1 Tax=Microbacterium horticulturae TaxID=3028316 RepID=A0ABY8BZG6_9MICO|nr:histidine kinase [Microbacterium sp. KACC 23027]WEG08867.1 histidine kinase [Microbacterium sp. KACC 23027]